MVYKIRNKSFFWTKTGWKNNYFPKSFNMPRPSASDSTLAIRCRYDHHSFLRAHQAYRNFSRHCKQYFYGDKKLEEIFILGLRTFFKIPLVSDTPTDLIKHGGERRMVDQLDRDFELVSYNTHPYQLFTYEVNNKYLADEHEDYELRKSGQETFEDEILGFVDELVAEEQKKIGENEQISLERMTEIIYHVFDKAKAQQNKPAEDHRGPDGNIHDYLEVRRPFVSPTYDKHTN